MYVCSISLSPGLASQLEVLFVRKSWGANAKLDSELAGHIRLFLVPVASQLLGRGKKRKMLGHGMSYFFSKHTWGS